MSDVNDNSPVFTEDLISITVSEGESVGRSLITVTATDEDSGTNGEISYFLDGMCVQSGLANKLFFY